MNTPSPAPLAGRLPATQSRAALFDSIALTTATAEASSADSPTAARTALLGPLKQGLQDLARELETRFRAGHPVQELVSDRAFAVEQLVLAAWDGLLPANASLALVAVGGFGRGELHPHSDVDILVLFEGERPDAADAKAIEALVMLLWDAGFYLGHSVRNVAQCREEAVADVATATTLMESRLLSGPVELFEAMRAATGPDQIWPAKDFFHAKYEEQQARHAQFGDTAYNLEPNIKEGPGGLRDIQMIAWVARRHFGASSLEGLVEHGFLTASECRELVGGQQFLWQVRFALHVLAGRAEDRLLFDHQREVAALFGHSDETGTNVAVERFMQSYYRVVTGLERLNERLLQLFREELLDAGLPAGESLGPDYRVVHGYLEVPDPELFRRRPEALIELFLVLTRHPEIAGVRAATQRLVVANLHRVDRDFRHNERVLALFCELLTEPQGVYRQLRRMNRYGLLAAFLPAFSNIVGRMQFDLFHVYTVDQHILFVLRNLRRFSYGKYQDIYPHTAEVFQRVERPLVLYLAALFHDIAKGRSGDHSELGAHDASEFCARLPMPEADRELVAWLVRHHLLMSQTAQKKDIGDPETVRGFAQVVSDRRKLDHLYLLTVADISGTSPRIWNSWKGGLLWELYQATRAALSLDPDKPVDREQHVAEARAVVRARLLEDGLQGEAVDNFWARLPDSVFLRFGQSQLTWSTEQAVAGRDAPVQVAVRRRDDRGVSEILVCAPDYTGLFATTTSVLDELGLNVLSARVVTGTDARSFDLFQVMDRHGQPLHEHDTDALHERLMRALAARQVLAPVRRPLPRRLRPFVSRPVIGFRPARGGAVTEMEVECSDRPGLLSQLAAAMVGSGVRIHDAMIATFGDRVEDIFLVTDAQDRPLDANLRAELVEAIHGRLDQGDGEPGRLAVRSRS